jgi:hypothetical protein
MMSRKKSLWLYVMEEKAKDDRLKVGILWIACTFFLFLIVEEIMKQSVVSFGNKMLFGNT